MARISAPALRIFATVNASAGGCESFMPTLPPVVGMSNVLKLSLRTIGMQCSGPAAEGLALYCRSIVGRRLQGLRIHRDDGAKRRALQVVGLDPVEIQPGQLRAGKRARGERGVDAGDGRVLRWNGAARLLRAR